MIIPFCWDRRLLHFLYEDWLNAGGDWTKSSVYYNSLEKSKFNRRGKYVYMTYRDVEAKYSSAIAKNIKKNKLELEQNRAEHEDAWYCKHPEVDDEVFSLCLVYYLSLLLFCFFSKANVQGWVIYFKDFWVFFCLFPEAWDLLRMWDSLELEESYEAEQEWGLRHQGHVTEEHSKGLLLLDGNNTISMNQTPSR